MELKMYDNVSVKKHRNRPDLTGEHPWGDSGQLVLLIVFLIVWFADTFFINLTETDYLNVPLWIRIPLGTLILICGLYLAKKSMKEVFETKREKPQLINDKIYNKIRHPMYLGSILFYLGVTVLMFSLPLFLIFTIIFVFYDFIARHEEKLLLNQFGDDYAQYMKGVRRWIPKF